MHGLVKQKSFWFFFQKKNRFLITTTAAGDWDTDLGYSTKKPRDRSRGSFCQAREAWT
jgi:hypothetical protein